MIETTVNNAGMMRAFATIRGYLPISAMIPCPALATKIGVRSAWIKYEGSLPTGSFKVRGAINLASQTAAGTNLFTHSSGNWAQGIAYAGRCLNLPVTVFMKPTASELKRERTRSWGATVLEIDGQPDQMTAIVKTQASQAGGVFVSPYDHNLIIEGHASCGVEIIHASKALKFNTFDVVLPVSGGGLAAGVAFAVKSNFCNPTARVVCVEPQGCDDFGESLRAGSRIAIASPRVSIADGLLANQVGECNWPVLRDNVDQAVTVSDEEMIAAMAFLFNELGIIAEPSGASTVAAGLCGKFKPEGDHTVFVVSGRNIESDAFLEMIGKTTLKKPAKKKATT